MGYMTQGRGKMGLRQAGNPTQSVGQFDGAQDGLGHRLGGGHSQGIDVGVTVARGQREDGIAVEHGVHRIDRPRHAERGELRQFTGLHFVQNGIGSDHPESRVPAGKTARGLLLQAGRGVQELAAAGIFARAGDNFARCRDRARRRTH